MDSKLDGRNVVITGANTGIGRVTAEVLARRGAKVYLACRSEDRTKPVLDAISTFGGKAEFLALDLADLDQIRSAAKVLLSKNEPIHVLINNAGLGGARGATKQGFELAFGTNHLGHFLFTQLLLPRMRESTPARIVNVSSKSHLRAKGIPFDRLRESTPSAAGIPEYSVSKLANVLFSKELARREEGKGITTYALHPGVIATDIWREVPRLFRPLVTMFMKSVEQGAETTLYCACSPVCADETGLYYEDCAVTKANKLADDKALAKELWERSEEWTRLEK